VLEPGPPADSHPDPVELDLPSLTVAADIDLHTWLFAFGAGIRIESRRSCARSIRSGWWRPWRCPPLAGPPGLEA
jgi:hypothetical protein